MLSHSVYNVLHVIGIILIMSSLGALSLHAVNGGTRDSNRARRLTAGLHGLGAFLVLLGGFGMLARIGFQHGSAFPGWLLVKIAIWLVLAVAVVLPYRRPALARPLLLLLPVLGGLAAVMAIYKPF
jgi:uncharacterized membrane protein SirB2